MVRLVGLDPSTKCTGYAVLDAARDSLLDAGLIKPSNMKPPFYERVSEMVPDAVQVVREVAPCIVVIEVPDKYQAGRLSRAEGLAKYGFAVGAIWCAVRSLPGVVVHTVTPALWTGGVPKRKRCDLLALRYPAYARAKDKGGDAGDAIGLVAYYRDRMTTRVQIGMDDANAH